jgi:hypothetical protein
MSGSMSSENRPPHSFFFSPVAPSDFAAIGTTAVLLDVPTAVRLTPRGLATRLDAVGAKTTDAAGTATDIVT